MKHLLLITLLGVTTPLLTFAQATGATGGQQTLQGFIKNFVLFLNSTIIPFLLGIAFLVFVINVIRFFVFQSNNEDGQKAAKALALYSILAFVIIIIFWGIVNLLTSSLGLRTGGAPTSDYVDKTKRPGTVPSPTNANSAVPAQQPSPGPGQNEAPRQFTPPINSPDSPPPITDELEGEPDPFLIGGPAQSNL